MDLTVAISCNADSRIFQCLDSIDEEVETIVMLVPHRELEAALIQRGVRVFHTKLGNYSINCNIGINAASNDRIILTDSDCLFSPGCLMRLYNLLDNYPLARARIKFIHSHDVFLSYAIARHRSSINNRLPIPAYTPGLGLSRSEVGRSLGGKFFDDRVIWGGDSEFNRRVGQAGLIVGLDSEAEVVHGPISLNHELRSSYLLGQGNRIQTFYRLRPNYETPSQLLLKLWPTNLIKSTRKSIYTSGFFGPIISLMWIIGYYIGYYSYSIGGRYAKK